MFQNVERNRVGDFSKTVDNFVDKSLRALNVARKVRLNGMLENQGPVAGEIYKAHKINGFGYVDIHRPWSVKISENRL